MKTFMDKDFLLSTDSAVRVKARCDSGSTGIGIYRGRDSGI